MWSSVHRLFRNDRAAIAPTVALALFGLIAAGGIAFDYARVASLDTELQQAADQAALAAATQLDRSDGAQARATAAIQNPSSTRLASNITRFANDGSSNGSSVEITDITFCKDFDDTIADTTTACTEAAGDSDSAFVIVRTELRTANYAFTPIVAAFSGTVSASAVAGVQSSICNVAPLMVCVADNDFPTDADIGKGIIMKVAGGNSWVPGNYGYLDFGNGNQAVIDALMGHGLNGCQNTDDNQTEPGNKNATDAINTRMDVYGGSGATNSPSVCNLSNGTGCPAPNTRKDMTQTMTYTIKQATALGVPSPGSIPACGAAATGNGNPNPSVTYTPSGNFNDPTAASAPAGFPRDSCHYSGACGNFGDGNWNRTTYMATNHPGISVATVAAAVGKTTTTLTRYDVYNWELANKASGAMNTTQIGSTTEVLPRKVQGSNTTYTFTKQCSFPQPRFASSNYPAEKDRRLLPIVAADCSNLKGKGSAFEDYVILRVFDIFLPEPSMQRNWYAQPTDDKEIYGEVVGPAETVGGTNGFQYYARNKPYLVR
jgi:Flp pilus assembly protein TadG